MFSARIFREISITKAVARRFVSSTSNDGTPLFFQPPIYNLLRLITLGDHGPASASLVHRPTTYKVGGSGPPTSESDKNSKRSRVALLTDEELKKTLQNAALLTRQRLQMPPVLPARTRADVLLEEEPRLAGIVPEGQSIVFTDVSINDDITDRTRLMVARRSDGSLYSVNWEERDRLQKVFFPLPGQRIQVPLMFEPAHLKAMLAQKKYRYILDRACVQFEPDDPLFISTRSAVFDHILAQGPLEEIYGTRHLGPLALHAVLTHRFQPLLLFLQNRSLKATLGLIHLLQEVTSLNWNVVAGSKATGKKLKAISTDLEAELTDEEQIVIKNAARRLVDEGLKLDKETAERITQLRNELMMTDSPVEKPALKAQE